MRLLDIISENEQIDEITRPTMVRAEYLLLRAGYKRTGEGYFAKVYGRADADHVLKLFKARDTAYMAFVNMVIKNPNPHFPKFKGKMMRVTDDYYAIRMERLEPMPDKTELGDSMSIAIKIERYMIYRNDPDSASSPEAIADTENFMQILESSQPRIRRACDLVVDKLVPTYLLDLHSANIMQRGAVMVLTDPIS
jgi:hypothetical protein